MPFFHFNQNNSGGSFDFDGDAGISHHVVIEAESSDQANLKAQSIGLYFDGCQSGIDCPCCGDRWSEVWADEGEAEPLVYDEPVEYYNGPRWMGNNPVIYVHYADGRFEGFPEVA